MVGSCRGAALLLAVCALAAAFAPIRGEVYSEATQLASIFNIELTGEAGANGQCVMKDGPKTVEGPVELLVQHLIEGTLNFKLPGGHVLDLVSISQNNSYLTVALDGQDSIASLAYLANGTASGLIEVEMALHNQSEQVCAYTITFVAQEGTVPFVTLGQYNNAGNVYNIEPSTPAGFSLFEPDRKCLVPTPNNGTVEGPFNVFVPYGQTFNLTHTSPSSGSLYVMADAAPNVNVTESNDGTFISALFSAYGNGLPAKLRLGLSQPTSCETVIYLIPFAGPTLNTLSGGALSSPPPPPPADPVVAGNSPAAAPQDASDPDIAAPTPAAAAPESIGMLGGLPALLAPALGPVVAALPVFGRRMLL